MILLQDKTGVNPPSSEYPFGDLRDITPSTNGTRVNRTLISDIVQTFEKIFSRSGKTANGLIDNETNGFQMYDALQQVVSKKYVKEIQSLIDNDNITVTRAEIETAFGDVDPFSNGFFGTATTSNTNIDFELSIWRKNDSSDTWIFQPIGVTVSGVTVTTLQTNNLTGNITFTLAGSPLPDPADIRIIIKG